MQFSAIVNRFIVKTLLNSAFTNDLKRKDFFFGKMFIVADLVSLIKLHLRKAWYLFGKKVSVMVIKLYDLLSLKNLYIFYSK